jgi:nucleotide-binding universal stress UspA family protein
MKNILVPTDFSTTAKNAARYALQLAAQIGAPKVIFYNAYSAPIIVDPMVPAVQLLNEENLKKDSQDALDKFQLFVKAFCPKDCEVETYCEYALLNNGLNEVCQKTNSELIVMGITGGGLLTEKLIGSNTLSVAKHSDVPVIIVPANSRFTRIEEVMLLSDFDKADDKIPMNPVRRIIELTKAKFFVFNVEKEVDEFGVTYPSNVLGESYAVHTLLQDLNPEYHFTKNQHYMQAIDDFVKEHHIDLIITIPQKHSFFEKLFSSSHTKMLAFHSHIPLMVMHR